MIKYWNVNTGQLIRTYYGHDDYIRALKLATDGKHFVIKTELFTY